MRAWVRVREKVRVKVRVGVRAGVRACSPVVSVSGGPGRMRTW